MPTLDWIGKAAVLNHDQDVPTRLLHCDATLCVGPPDSPNLLVEGDNLLALKALLPFYGGTVKCIYIDPPYNTGNEGWIYNDNARAPEIARWLGQVVGRDAEDLSRHDKWLCMMYPRLKLLKAFLRDDGAIFISIDDNEVAHLRLLLDEIFGARNFVANVVWQKRTSPDGRLNLGPAHDHILVYCREKQKLALNLVALSEARSKDYKNPDNDPRGLWASVDLTGQTGHATASQFYSIQTPNGGLLRPPRNRCWALAESTFAALQKDNRIWFGADGNARPRLKKFWSEAEKTTTWTWWPHADVGHNQEAMKELHAILGEKDSLFDTPKPTRLIKRILEIATDEGDLVLDSFMGSGTTGHAALMLNRRFIGVEMESAIARPVTYERLRRAVEGYGDIAALGGGFRFCALGQPLFDETGQLRADAGFWDIAHYVFFSETGRPLPARLETNGPFIGASGNVSYFLIVRGALNKTTLKHIGGDGAKVVYAPSCRLTRVQLERAGIVFKQLPYEVKTR